MIRVVLDGSLIEASEFPKVSLHTANTDSSTALHNVGVAWEEHRYAVQPFFLPASYDTHYHFINIEDSSVFGACQMKDVPPQRTVIDLTTHVVKHLPAARVFVFEKYGDMLRWALGCPAKPVLEIVKNDHAAGIPVMSIDGIVKMETRELQTFYFALQRVDDSKGRRRVLVFPNGKGGFAASRPDKIYKLSSGFYVGDHCESKALHVVAKMLAGNAYEAFAFTSFVDAMQWAACSP